MVLGQQVTDNLAKLSSQLLSCRRTLNRLMKYGSKKTIRLLRVEWLWYQSTVSVTVSVSLSPWPACTVSKFFGPKIPGKHFHEAITKITNKVTESLYWWRSVWGALEVSIKLSFTDILSPTVQCRLASSAVGQRGRSLERCLLPFSLTVKSTLRQNITSIGSVLEWQNP